MPSSLWVSETSEPFGWLLLNAVHGMQAAAYDVCLVFCFHVANHREGAANPSSSDTCSPFLSGFRGCESCLE